VIEKHLPAGVKLPEVPAVTKAAAIPTIKLTSSVTLFNNLPMPVGAEHPLCFEDLDQGYGFVLYRTTLKDSKKGTLKIKEMRDFATIYLNGKRVAAMDRRLKQDSVELDVPANATLDILVENNGRINYGLFLTDNRQGITEKVTLGGTELLNWKMYKFPFENINGIKFVPGTKIDTQPGLYQGTFDLTQTADTYLDMHGFGKGFVYVNGHNLGKYWEIGPTQTIYVPAGWLKKGKNEVVVFDELRSGHTELKTLDRPVLDVLVK